MQRREDEMAKCSAAAATCDGGSKPESSPPVTQDQERTISEPGDREPSHEAVGDVQAGKANPSAGTIDDKELQTYDLVSLNSNSTYMEEEVRVTMIRSHDRESQLQPDNSDDEDAGNVTKSEKSVSSSIVALPADEKDACDVETLRACSTSPPQPGTKSNLTTMGANEVQLLVVHAADALLGTEDGSTEVVVAELQGGWQVSVCPASDADPVAVPSKSQDTDHGKNSLEILQPSRLFGEEPGSKYTSENEEEQDAGGQVVKCGSVERLPPVNQQANEPLEYTPSPEPRWEPPIAMEQVSTMSSSSLDDTKDVLQEIEMDQHGKEKPPHSKDTSVPQMNALKNEFDWESTAIAKDLAKVRQLGAQEARDMTTLIVESYEGSPTGWIDLEYNRGRKDVQARQGSQSESETLRGQERRDSSATLPESMTHQKVAMSEANRPTYVLEMGQMCGLTCTSDAKRHMEKTDSELSVIVTSEVQETALRRTDPICDSNFDTGKTADFSKPTRTEQYDSNSPYPLCGNEVRKEATQCSNQTSLNEDAAGRPLNTPGKSTPKQWTQVGPLQVHNAGLTAECVSELTSLTSEGDDEEEDIEYAGTVRSCTTAGSPRVLDFRDQCMGKARKGGEGEEEKYQLNPQIILNAPSTEEPRTSKKEMDERDVLIEGGTEETSATLLFPNKNMRNVQAYDKRGERTLGESFQMHTTTSTSRKTKVTGGALDKLNTLPLGIQAESTAQYTCDTTLWEQTTTPIDLGHISEMTSFTSEEEDNDIRHPKDYSKSQIMSISRNTRRQEEATLVVRSEVPSARTERVSELTPLCSSPSEEKDRVEQVGGQSPGSQQSPWTGVDEGGGGGQVEQDRSGTTKVHDPELPRTESSLQTIEFEGGFEFPTPLRITGGVTKYMGTGDESLASSRHLLKVNHPKTETSETGTLSGSRGGGCGRSKIYEAVSQLLPGAQKCMPYERHPIEQSREPISCISLTEAATTTTKMVCGAVQVSFNRLDNIARLKQASSEQYEKTNNFPVTFHGFLQPNTAASKLIAAAVQGEGLDWTAGKEACAPEVLWSRLGDNDDTDDLIAITATAAADTYPAIVKEKVASGLEEIATENEVTTQCLDDTLAAVWWCAPAQSVRTYTGDQKDAGKHEEETATLLPGATASPAKGTLVDRREETSSARHQIITVTLPLGAHETMSTADDDEEENAGEPKDEYSRLAQTRDEGSPKRKNLEQQQQQEEEIEVGGVILTTTTIEPSDAVFTGPPTEAAEAEEMIRSARTPSPRDKGLKEALAKGIDTTEGTAMEKQSAGEKIEFAKEDSREQPCAIQISVVTQSGEQQEVSRPLHKESEEEKPSMAEYVQQLTSSSSAKTASSRRREAIMTAVYLDGLIRDTVAALRYQRRRVKRPRPAVAAAVRTSQLSCFCWRQ